MSDQQAINKGLSSQGSSTVRCQTQNEIVKVKFVWTIHEFEFLKTFESWGNHTSSDFLHEKNPSNKWYLQLSGEGPSMNVNLSDFNSSSSSIHPVQVTIGILSRKREKLFLHQSRLPRRTKLPYCVFQIEKQKLMESGCFVNGNLTIDCEIQTLIQKAPVKLLGQLSIVADFHEKTCGNSDRLVVAKLEELFENMKLSDITFNVRGRQFQAHKNILAARSPFFAAMFEHPTKENLTNQIEVEDVEPAVFHEILRFIYTGRLSESMMEKMPFEILRMADKYLLDELKMECEIQLIHRMSAENCVELLLFTKENHPAFHLKKYAVEFFRNYSSEVMASGDWEKAEQDDPVQCLSLVKELVK
jgi:speckle-type POZ protein